MYMVIVELVCIFGLIDILGVLVLVEECSFYGVGEVVCYLLDCGVCRFFVVLGGMSMNDVGVGFLVVFGIRFFDVNDYEVMLFFCDFDKIVRVDVFCIDFRLSEISFFGMIDVDNLFIGFCGVICVFGF